MNTKNKFVQNRGSNVWGSRFLICAALGLTLGEPAHAALFNIAPGAVASLINAINLANASSEPDTINLALNSIYTLTRAAEGADGLPAITSTIAINGNGSIIQRSSAAAIPAFRVIEVSFGQLMLNDTIIRNGRADSGGGIMTNGTVNLANSTLSGNTAVGGDGFGGEGGGIANSGMLRIINSTLLQNSARLGGGIANLQFGQVNIANSNLAGNMANIGGGISNTSGGQVIINNSAMVRNSAAVFGGGIDNFNGTIRFTNSTLFGNTSDSCGGINNEDGTVSLTNSTLSGSSGGGVCGSGGANVEITNSLIVNSVSGANCSSDDSFNTAGNNMDTDGTCLLLASGGGSFAQVSASQLKLGPLRNNGGRTGSQALLVGSRAIDAGSQAECDSRRVSLDQRSSRRAIDGNRDGVAICDIGAFEFGSPPALCAGQAVTVFGTLGTDNLHGTASRDVIRAFGADDVVLALGGDDLVCGGSGNDTIVSGPGNSQLYGEGGNDRLTGLIGVDRLEGGSGADQLFGSGGRDALNGGNGGDRLDGGADVDNCNGDGSTPSAGDSAINCETIRNVP